MSGLLELNLNTRTSVLKEDKIKKARKSYQTPFPPRLYKMESNL